MKNYDSAEFVFLNTARDFLCCRVGHGRKNAKATSNFLSGGGWQVSRFTPAPFAPWIGVGGGLNRSFGGKTAVEIGVSTQPGGSIVPLGYGLKKVGREKWLNRIIKNHIERN